MKIALTQFAASKNPADNLKKQLDMIGHAAECGAKIVCTQELFMSEYFCIGLDDKNFELAEKIPSSTTNELTKCASKFDIAIVASLFENRGNEIYHNTAIVINADGNILGKYRKNHIPHDPCFEEKYYFAEGDLGYPVWNTKYGKIAVLVCWDQWYPEAARLAALNGAEIIFYPTAIGVLPNESENDKRKFYNAWQTVQRGHAVANGAYVAAANRVGTEGNGERRINFFGGSFISNPYGEVLAKGSEINDEIIIADIDLSEVAKFRRTWPFFRDRRIDTYGGLSNRLNDR